MHFNLFDRHGIIVHCSRETVRAIYFCSSRTHHTLNCFNRNTNLKIGITRHDISKKKKIMYIVLAADDAGSHESFEKN